MDRWPRGETELVAKSADDVRPISWAVLNPQCHLAHELPQLGHCDAGVIFDEGTLWRLLPTGLDCAKKKPKDSFKGRH